MRLFDRTILITVCACLAFLMAVVLFVKCKKKPKKAKRGRKRSDAYWMEESQSVPYSSHKRDRFSYSTMRPQFPKPIFTAENRSKPLELDNLSITTTEIDALSHNREFLDNPISVLKRSGVTKTEIRQLMSHPDFLDDPLAALRRPKTESTGDSESSIKFESPGRSGPSSNTTVHFQSEPPLLH